MTTNARIKNVEVSVDCDTLFHILQELESGLLDSARSYGESKHSIEKFMQDKGGILDFMRNTIPIAMPGTSFEYLMKQIKFVYEKYKPAE